MKTFRIEFAKFDRGNRKVKLYSVVSDNGKRVQTGWTRLGKPSFLTSETKARKIADSLTLSANFDGFDLASFLADLEHNKPTRHKVRDKPQKKNVSFLQECASLKRMITDKRQVIVISGLKGRIDSIE